MHSIDDIDLAAALAAALHRNPLVPATILVDVADGIVTLEGEVERPKQREEADGLVRRFRGVMCVVNHITLKPEAHADARPWDGMGTF